MSDQNPTSDDIQDQDAEPSLNAPGDADPSGVTADGETPDASADSADQDAEPTKNAPGDAGA